MGGKTNTTTQKVEIPQQVLQRYADVNAQAQSAAATPFQPYSSDPNAFVAPLNQTQQAGISGTNAAAGQAQPYYSAATSQLLGAQNATTPYFGAAGSQLNAAGQTIGGIGAATSAAQPYNTAATGLAMAGTQAVNPTNLDASAINKYMSPYLSTVLGSTAQLLNQNNTQQQNSALGNIIRGGGFGGDRAGIAAANLNQQQNLANASIYSGILNNAYTNALSTAQQQQGVGLGAAQANRAALQEGAGQIQGIGQQVFGQGTGAEQLQYQQQAGLAGAQQGLGQAIYSTGANTSQGLAALGTGAQAAGLQGAQAQLAAGQQQQQTEQAGKSALYNQYLMQQSYPFQVAQFLANIAEGTGSLSGQTVATTQPGSLFSDERVKDHKRLVGFTFDGQPIFVFKYKGDDTTHMGLMAQEVEKHHPEAVGETGGIKTVNYDQATEDAADRGHFKTGGLVPYKGYAYGGAPSGGFDPGLAAAMLQNSQGMFGPYLTGQGGAPAGGGGPYGAAARVPSANLPVSSMKSPDLHVQAPESGLATAAKTADQVSGLVSNVEKGADWVKHKLPANDSWGGGPPEDVGSDLPFRQGGRVRYAAGGAPYQGGLALQIPYEDDQGHYKLPDPPSPPKEGGSSTVGDIAAAAQAAAKVASMFMNRGGLAQARNGFADGGSPNFDETGLSFLSDDGQPDPGTTARAHIQNPKPDYESPNFDETGASLRPSMNDKVAATLKSWSETPPKAPAARSAPRTRGLASANDPWAAGPPTDWKGTATPEDQVASPGLSIAAPDPATMGADLNQTPPDVHVPTGGSQDEGAAPDHRAILNGIVDRVAPHGSYLDRLFHGDRMTLLPFLAALGAATGAKTQNTFTALAQGLAAGAGTYQNLYKQQADIEQTRAQTGRIDTGTQQDIQAHAPPGTVVVPGFDQGGKGFMVAGKPYHYELQVNATNFGAAAPGVPGGPPAAIKPAATTQAPSADTDAYMAQTYGIDPHQVGAANRMMMLSKNPALATQEAADEKRAQERIGNLGEADSTHRNLLQSADALSKMSKGTLTGQGYNSAYRAQLTNLYSTVRGMLGLGPDETATQDLTAHQITEKIRQLTGSQIAHQYGERAASVAHGIAAVLPSGDLTPEAAGHILAQMMVQNQQQRDFSAYHNNHVSKYGTAINVEPSFQRDTGRIYDQEQQNLTKVIRAGQMDTILGYLNNPDPATRQAAMAKIDQKFGEGFHRYFTGGQ